MFCKNCGAQLPDGTKFCTSCGADTQEQDVQQTSNPMPPAGYQPAYPGVMVVAPEKKGRGCLIAIIAVIASIAIILGALLLFVPGLLRPASLKVKPTESDYLSALSKLQYTKDDSPQTGEAGDFTNVYGPTHPVDTALTSNEATAFMSYNRPPYYAVDNFQIRFNADGTTEISGTMAVEYLLDKILTGEYSLEDIEDRFPMLGLLPDNINFYMHFAGTIQENRLSDLVMHSVKVQGIPLPKSILEETDSVEFVEHFTDMFLDNTTSKSGAYFEYMANEAGQLVFRGTMPDSLERVLAK